MGKINFRAPVAVKTKQFIEQAINVHGSKYNYSKTKYVRNFDEVIIICPEHGEFTRTPNAHVHSKLGCPNCQSRGNNHGKYMTYSEFRIIENNAKTRNLDFDITIDDVESIYESQSKKCKLSGADLYFTSTIKDSARTTGNASVDRIDSSKGYTVDNIQLVEKRINTCKSWFEVEEFLEICESIVNYQKSLKSSS